MYVCIYIYKHAPLLCTPPPLPSLAAAVWRQVGPHALGAEGWWNNENVPGVEDKRPLCQLSSKRLEDNWHSGLLSYTKHRLSGGRSPDCRRVNHLRPTGSRTPDSRCFVEDKRPLCQLSSRGLEDNWHSGLLSSTPRTGPGCAVCS